MTLEELDRLAAEKVMGWKYRSPREIEDASPYRGMAVIVGDYTYQKDGTRYFVEVGEWQPTRNIAQAWECLVQIPNLLPNIWKRSDNQWGCNFFEYESAREFYSTWCPTIEEAIVRACLKAKGVEL